MFLHSESGLNTVTLDSILCVCVFLTCWHVSICDCNYFPLWARIVCHEIFKW